MPRTQQEEMSVFSLSPMVSGANNSDSFEALDFDHLLLNIDLSLGSLTSVDLHPEMSHDGTNYDLYYDANGSQVTWNFTADFEGWRPLGQANNVTRLQPLFLIAPNVRLVATANGTPNGSSTLTLTAIPFVLGGF